MKTLLKNGKIYDGTGSASFMGDILIEDDKIVKVAENIEETADTVFDLTGKSISSGFIDSHSHNDWFAIKNNPLPYFDPFIRQGNAASEVIEKHRDKYGVAEALKLIYREYDKNNFLYDSDSTDFTILMNKLSEEQAKKIEESNHMGEQLFSGQPHLKFKVDAGLAMSVIYSLIMNIKNKDILPHNHMETFDFMVDHLIDSLYE